MSVMRDISNRFCTCGKPLEIYMVRQDQVPPPIEWVENGCSQCRDREVTKKYRQLKSNSTH